MPVSSIGHRAGGNNVVEEQHGGAGGVGEVAAAAQAHAVAAGCTNQAADQVMSELQGGDLSELQRGGQLGELAFAGDNLSEIAAYEGGE